MSISTRSLPAPKDLYSVVVAALGLLTECHSTRSAKKDDTIRIVVEMLGHDPDDLPDPWKPQGHKGIARQIFYAWRNQREGYTSNPLCADGPKRGRWALTPEGARRAREMNTLGIDPSELNDAVLSVLGRRSEYKQVPVRVDSTFYPEAMRTAGFDPRFLYRSEVRRLVQDSLFHMSRCVKRDWCGRSLSLLCFHNGHPRLGTVAIKRAAKLNGIKPLPQPSDLTDAVLDVLREHGADKEAVRLSALRPEIAKAAGYDPDNLPEGWKLNGSKSLYRQIWYACRNLSEGFRHGAEPLTVNVSRGMWKLTPAAVLDVGQPEPEVEVVDYSDRNLTAEWISENVAALTPYMIAALGRQFPAMKRTDQLEDLIQAYYVKAIERDAFRPYLEKNLKVTFANVACFAIRMGINYKQAMGCNPVCRELVGARTATDSKNSKEADLSIWHTVTVNHAANQVTFSKEAEVLDFEDEGVLSSPDTLNDLESVKAEMERVIRTCWGDDADDVITALEMKVLGFSDREIAAEIGVSEQRASTIIHKARKACRQDPTLKASFTEVVGVSL